MLKAILFTTIKNSICQKILKTGAIYQFCIFFQVEVSSKTQQQASYIFQHWRNLRQVTKTVKFSYHKGVLLLFKGGGGGWLKMEETQKLQKFHFFFWFLNLHNLLERVYPYKFQNTLNYFLMHQKKKKKKKLAKVKNPIFFFKNWHPRSLCVTIWKFWKSNSTSVLMPYLPKKLWMVGKWNCPRTK